METQYQQNLSMKTFLFIKNEYVTLEQIKTKAVKTILKKYLILLVSFFLLGCSGGQKETELSSTPVPLSMDNQYTNIDKDKEEILHSCIKSFYKIQDNWQPQCKV